MNDLKLAQDETIVIPDKNFQIALLALEEKMRESKGFVEGSFFPLKHSFAHGLYIREIFVQAGYVVMTYIHKHSHPAFCMQGDVTVFEKEGSRRAQAPLFFITEAKH